MYDIVYIIQVIGLQFDDLTIFWRYVKRALYVVFYCFVIAESGIIVFVTKQDGWFISKDSSSLMSLFQQSFSYAFLLEFRK